MEDLPVGAEVILKVVEAENCDGCFFDELACNMYADIYKRIKCYRLERKDKKNVQFKRVKRYGRKY